MRSVGIQRLSDSKARITEALSGNEVAEKERHDMSQQYVKGEYPLSDVTARIIAAATEVHRGLGPGFEEVIYQRALARELPAHNLEFSREVWMDVRYKGEKVGSKRAAHQLWGRQVAGQATGELRRG